MRFVAMHVITSWPPNTAEQPHNREYRYRLDRFLLATLFELPCLQFQAKYPFALQENTLARRGLPTPRINLVDSQIEFHEILRQVVAPVPFAQFRQTEVYGQSACEDPHSTQRCPLHSSIAQFMLFHEDNN